MVKDSGSDLGEALVGIALGILGGLALGSLLDHLFNPKCPRCKQPINREMKICPSCGYFLDGGDI